MFQWSKIIGRTSGETYSATEKENKGHHKNAAKRCTGDEIVTMLYNFMKCWMPKDALGTR